MKIKLASVFILILLAVIFIVQNGSVVDVQIFFWVISISRVLLMLIFLLIGIIIGFVLNSYIRYLKSARQ